jgi:ERCC4-type nuclease
LDPAIPLTVIEGLHEGDYSARLVTDEGGVLLPVRVERKSLGDLYGVCGYGRDRFERELVRLAGYPRAYLVIEAELRQVLAGFERSRISGRAVLTSVASWAQKFGVAPIFAGDRRLARAWTQRVLEEAAADAAMDCGRSAR